MWWLQPMEIQKEMVQQLSERAANVHAGIVDSSKGNMPKITSDGRKRCFDQRVINPDLPDDLAGKVNLCVDNIVKIYRDAGYDLRLKNGGVASITSCRASTCFIVPAGKGYPVVSAIAE